jgi:predicted ATPase
MELAGEALELATSHELASWIAEGAMLRGWALVFGGREAEGVQLVLNGLAEENKIRDTGWYFGGWPAEACGRAGRIREALELVANLLKPGHEVYVFEADLHRVKGELLLMNDPSNIQDAENSFRIAIDLARRGNLKSLSLSATTSLARLLAGQGRHEEARAMLAEIYGWFTEGFDTADLKDAKALLDDLKSQAT